MKVTCIGNNGRYLPEKYLASGNSIETIFQVSLGELYIVYGICLWDDDDTLHYLLMGKNENLPSWYPAELFQVTDKSLPFEWYFNFNSVREQSLLTAIWGYEELVKDPKHHDALIERESDAIEVFLKRKSEIEEFM